MEQNYKNHRRYVPVYHGAILLVLLGLIGSVINFVRRYNEGSMLTAALIVVIFVLITVLFYYVRHFALVAQDRAIRAEENFRHFILTGKPLDRSLRMGQIIGLRFASDEEFPELAKRAIEEKLSMDDIKKLIKNWRGDYYRV